ncbi:PRR36 protein, partial [Polypterus senegalus]
MTVQSAEPGNEASPPGDVLPPQSTENQQAAGNPATPKSKAANGKAMGEGKPKAKGVGGAVKGRPNAAPVKTTSSAASSKTNDTHARTSNGTQRPITNGVAKKNPPTATEKKVAAVAPAKKPVAPNAKIADKKLGVARPATAPSSSTLSANGVKQTVPTKKPGSTGVTTAKVRPSTSASSTLKTTSTAPSKSTVGPAAGAKTEKPGVTKTSRPVGSSQAATRPTSNATSKPPAPKPASAKVGSTAPSSARTAAVASKPSSAPANKKVPDASKVSIAKKPIAATAPIKPSKSETPKVASAVPATNTETKRLSATPKATEKVKAKIQQESKTQPSPLKTTASPRTPSRAGLMKTASPSPKKTIGSSAPMPVKRLAKPTQSVQPIMSGGTATKEAQPPATSEEVTATPEAVPVVEAQTSETVLESLNENAVPQDVLETTSKVPEEPAVQIAEVQPVVPDLGDLPQETPLVVLETPLEVQNSDLTEAHQESVIEVPASLKETTVEKQGDNETPIPEKPILELQEPDVLEDHSAAVREPLLDLSEVTEVHQFATPEVLGEHRVETVVTPLQEDVPVVESPESLHSPDVPMFEEQRESNKVLLADLSDAAMTEMESLHDDLLKGPEKPQSALPDENVLVELEMNIDKSEIEKADTEINNDDDDHSEDSRVSVSEMSDAPVTESRTMAEPTEYMEKSEMSGMDLHHGMVSEMDSEDVSHPCMSELSAPESNAGMLESMDDLNEVGRGGSPDIEIVPDIQDDLDQQRDAVLQEANPEMDLEDRECEMDVGSEKVEGAEDVDQEEDEDVEMVSEVVTESGHESCGNPEDEDFEEEEMPRELEHIMQATNLNNLTPIHVDAALATVAPSLDVLQDEQRVCHSLVDLLELHNASDFQNVPNIGSAAEAWVPPQEHESDLAQAMSKKEADFCTTELPEQSDAPWSASQDSCSQSAVAAWSEESNFNPVSVLDEFSSAANEPLATEYQDLHSVLDPYEVASEPPSLLVESVIEQCSKREDLIALQLEKCQGAAGSSDTTLEFDPYPDESKRYHSSPPPPPEPEHEKGLSKSSTLSGPELAAQSSSETSTPEELKDFDSSSGVESRSDEKVAGVPPIDQANSPVEELPIDQDLGIHLDKGDDEAETLPADEILGDPPTEPASSSEDITEEEDDHSDTEGEMLINDPGAMDFNGIDNLAFEEKGKLLAAAAAAAAQENKIQTELQSVDETEEHLMSADAGGADTPHSANSVASYVFDSTSNAHSTAESCGKSPGIFSLENEDQLLEEGADPTLIKELKLQEEEQQQHHHHHHPPAEDFAQESMERVAPTYNDSDQNVDLLPLEDVSCKMVPQQLCLNPDGDEDCEYMSCPKTTFASMLGNFETDCPMASPGMLHQDLPSEDSNEDSPDNALSSSDMTPGDGDMVPPYYSAICEKTDNVLAGNQNRKMAADNPPNAPVMLVISPGQQSSPTSLLGTIYEAMETSDDEEEQKRKVHLLGEQEIKVRHDEDEGHLLSNEELSMRNRKSLLQLDCEKADMVQQLIQQTLLISGEKAHLPCKGGTISEVEVSQWTDLISPLNDSACITSVTSYSPEDTVSPQGDWTVVELETHH